jgi:hypothetical protein
MGVYDQASRYAVKLDPPGFFAWRAPGFAARFAFLGWHDVSTVTFPGEPGRVCDTVAEFAARDGRGPRRLLDVECQSEPDPDMPERQGEYAFRLRREVRHGPGQAGKYGVACLLLNLTGPVQPRELDWREDDLDGDGLHFRLTQFTLREEDAAASLARVAVGDSSRCVLPWIPLMRGGDETSTIEEGKRLASGEPDARRRGDYGGLALVFAELAGRRDAWRRALEDWNVQVSQQVLEWQAKARQEGRQEEQVAQARSKILRALEVRLRSAVPSDVAAAVEAQADLDRLSSWFDAALTAADLPAFRAAAGL